MIKSSAHPELQRVTSRALVIGVRSMSISECSELPDLSIPKEEREDDERSLYSMCVRYGMKMDDREAQFDDVYLVERVALVQLYVLTDLTI